MKKMIFIILIILSANIGAMELWTQSFTTRDGFSELATVNLWQFVKSGDSAGIEQMLKEGADIQTRNKYGDTLLHCAAEHGHVNIIKQLVDAGIDVNARGRYGNTALMSAVVGNLEELNPEGKDYIPVIRELIRLGVDLNIKSTGRRTVLNVVLEDEDRLISSFRKNKNIEILKNSITKLLLESGAEISEKVYNELEWQDLDLVIQEINTEREQYNELLMQFSGLWGQEENQPSIPYPLLQRLYQPLIPLASEVREARKAKTNEL